MFHILQDVKDEKHLESLMRKEPIMATTGAQRIPPKKLFNQGHDSPETIEVPTKTNWRQH